MTACASLQAGSDSMAQEFAGCAVSSLASGGAAAAASAFSAQQGRTEPQLGLVAAQGEVRGNTAEGRGMTEAEGD